MYFRTLELGGARSISIPNLHLAKRDFIMTPCEEIALYELPFWPRYAGGK